MQLHCVYVSRRARVFHCRDAFVTVSLANRTTLFAPLFGAPVLELKNPAAVQIRRRELMRVYPVVARCVCRIVVSL